MPLFYDFPISRVCEQSSGQRAPASVTVTAPHMGLNSATHIFNKIKSNTVKLSLCN